jgi:hypothetical protein
MNQFFSFKRFSLLVLKHWAENKKRYGLSVLAFIGLLIAWFVVTMFLEGDELMPQSIQRHTFFLSLFVVGTFYASQYFRDLGERTKAINFLLVPASAFEKALCGLLYTVFLFLLVFVAAFYLVDVLLVAIANTLPAAGTPAGKATVINVFKADFFRFNNGSVINFLLFFFAVQSAFLLGSVYFRKYGFIKTIISGFVTWIVFFCLIYFYKRLLAGNENDEYLVLAPGWVWQVLSFLVMYVIAPFLWILSYYRLKRKQA